MDVHTIIKTFFSKAISKEIGDEDDIFALGLVNSLFAMQLVLFVEKEFSIVADGADLDIKNFCTINALTSFVSMKIKDPNGEESNTWTSS